MDRARSLPLGTKRGSSKEQRVVSDLKAHGYPGKFIEKLCEEKERETRSEVAFCTTAFASILYVTLVSESIQRILGQENVRTALWPIKILGDVFEKLKERPSVNQVTRFV